MEMTMTVGSASARKNAGSGGSLRMAVRDVRRDKKLDAELFRIPPAGYKRLDRNPYFKDAAGSTP
jgi:hypothetical protein